MIDQLPVGWMKCSLGDVISVQNGYAFPSKEFKRQGVPLVRQSNLGGNRVSLEKCVYLDPKWIDAKPDFVLRKNDLLIGMSGSVGKLCVYDLSEPALQNQRTGKIVPHSEELIEWRFIREYLKTIESQLLDKGKGLGVLNVSAHDIESLPIRLAPINEQRRIAVKLEKILARVGECQMRLGKTSILLKRFRQSVLAAAYQRKNCKEYKQLHEIFNIQSGGTPSRKESKFYMNGTVPWVKTGEVRNCDIFKTEELITELALKNSNAKIFPEGTLLIAMYGEGKTRGQIGRLRISAATNQACAALINQNLSIISNEYVYYFLLGQYQKLRQESFGGNQPNLNLGTIKSWVIPFPSEPEQEVIVKMVKKMFALADQLEARYVKAHAFVDKISLSILAKAFCGEIVPQDPKDEPAEVLLEKIKNQAEGEDENKKKFKRRRSK